MRMILGQNQYGKEQIRIVRVNREEFPHKIKDLTVSVSLSGDFDETHMGVSNSNVLVTDTQKNTAFAFAKEFGITDSEEFGIRLARHFVDSQSAVHRARIRIEEYAWEDAAGITPQGDSNVAPAARHTFVRSGREIRTAEIIYDGHEFSVTCGLTDLYAFKTSGSEFRGFVQDRYTTLEDTDDRVMTPHITARWRHSGSHGDQPDGGWEQSYVQARAHMLGAFADTYSLSQQQTLFTMGSRILSHCPEVEEIRLTLRNMHHFGIDLQPFGLTNDNEVFHTPDRPYGIMEGTILRDGSVPLIPYD